jgi:uncharacterized membrane protein YgcG
MPCGGTQMMFDPTMMMDNNMNTRVKKENYDVNQNVCGNQDDFNMAVKAAIKYTKKEDMKKARPWATICSVIWLIFLFWALMLAMRMPVGSERVEHVLFAIVFSPAYVLAHYLGVFVGSSSEASMGFARFGCGGSWSGGNMPSGAGGM